MCRVSYLNDQTTKQLNDQLKVMKKIFLFSWAQLMQLVSLLKPLIELVKSIIDVFKSNPNDDDDERK